MVNEGQTTNVLGITASLNETSDTGTFSLSSSVCTILDCLIYVRSAKRQYHVQIDRAQLELLSQCS